MPGVRNWARAVGNGKGAFRNFVICNNRDLGDDGNCYTYEQVNFRRDTQPQPTRNLGTALDHRMLSQPHALHQLLFALRGTSMADAPSVALASRHSL